MRMKLKSVNSALLLTTVLFAPSVALAQETSQAEVAQQADDAAASEGEDTEEVVVLGRFIPEPMRETSEVATFLSSEDLARTGDDNAASALTRLTGLSVVSGKFVYVRGLGDRYSSALLNGSPLPSPEPLRRQVPLDLFPSNILDGATVQKTFSPNYPGEFGGGIIDLRTLKIPTENFLTVKVGTAGNTESTDKRGLTYYGERNDWTGFSDNAREMPQELREALGRGRRITSAGGNFTETEIEILGESLTNSPLTVVQEEHFDPDFEGEITAGSSIDVGRFNIGLLGVVGYDNQYRTQRARRTNVAAGGAVQSDANTVQSARDIVFNGFASGTVGWDENSITLTGMLVRSTTKEAQQTVFDDEDNNPDFSQPGYLTESTAWYERQIASLQLAGEHRFGNLDLEWRGAFAQSTRDAPYERDITYDLNGAEPQYYIVNVANQTRFSELTDEVISGGIDGDYTIQLSEQRDLVLSAGYSYANTVRNYELYTFAFLGPADFGALTPAQQDALLRQRPDALFSPDNIDPQRFYLEEFFEGGADPAYKGRLTLNAAYAGADWEIIPLLRAALGFRYEDATQVVRAFNRVQAPVQGPIVRDEAYFLPAATLTWNFAEDLQLRLGYSKTIARPQFRELALVPYIDPDTDREYQGNPFLVDSEFQNYDARVEYYFGRQQFVTLGGFYKVIDKPIEEVVGLLSNEPVTRFINAPEATLYGAEVEYRTTFELPFGVPGLKDASWLFAINYAYTHSEVSTDGSIINPLNFLPADASTQITGDLKLQGTPENIANVQFGYETDASQLTLLVGWVDERISRRGLGGYPGVYEQPGTNVDLVYKRDFTLGPSQFTLGLSGRNLLNEKHEEYQTVDVIDPSAASRRAQLGITGNTTQTNTYERGRTISVSLTSKF